MKRFSEQCHCQISSLLQSIIIRDALSTEFMPFLNIKMNLKQKRAIFIGIPEAKVPLALDSKARQIKLTGDWINDKLQCNNHYCSVSFIICLLNVWQENPSLQLIETASSLSTQVREKI